MTSGVKKYDPFYAALMPTTLSTTPNRTAARWRPCSAMRPGLWGTLSGSSILVVPEAAEVDVGSAAFAQTTARAAFPKTGT